MDSPRGTRELRDAGQRAPAQEPLRPETEPQDKHRHHLFPVLICVLLIVLQNVINSELDKPKYNVAERVWHPSTRRWRQVGSCPIPSPPQWPALIQVPRADFRAVRTVSQPFDDLPDPFAVTPAISRGLFPVLSPSLNATDFLDILSKIVAVTMVYTIARACIFSGHTLYLVQPECVPFMSQTISYNIQCVEGFPLWRESASIINHELFKGYKQREINEFIAGYDFLGTTQYGLGLNVWYNSTYNENTAYGFIATLRVPRLVNAVSNAYLKFIKGTWVEMLLEYVKDMPKVGTNFQLDLSSLLSALFFTWIIELLFPVMLTYLVYEKQQKLKVMMKMHVVYMLFFVIFGSLIASSVQVSIFSESCIQYTSCFFFVCTNLQIALAFFVASFFLSVKMATVIGYMYVFGSGLLGAFLFRFFVEDKMFPYGWILIMEIVPGFSLYRGLYELEWALLLILAFYLDQASLLCGGNKSSLHEPRFAQQDSRVILDMEKSDVALERKVVEQLLIDPNANQAIICDNLRKVYPGRDGNPDKVAVRGLSLVLQKGQCFGMLGPNGAGKTSFINMMIGLIKPTSGTAYVHGMDINTDMGNIYTNMALLWETLTGKEHLFFYGRLKNLTGAELVKSVNLSHGNVGNKQVKKYSGGMKRRLSVAISLIGDPKPSTGLDPASRNNLWNVVKEAKRNRAIILTSRVLCDRLGIFVDGDFQCLGNPKEFLKLYGGTYIFTVTTSADQEQEVERLKFELPKQEVKIAHVFYAVEKAKRQLTIHAWGLVDTTLEDVFIKVAGAQAFNEFA
ncbi:hypothetical protein BS78_02G161800 [Paspalum vaginatum]|nr:hypothetical protein BS78_02G161800 [Paspalum vaginatum]